MFVRLPACLPLCMLFSLGVPLMCSAPKCEFYAAQHSSAAVESSLEDRFGRHHKGKMPSRIWLVGLVLQQQVVVKTDCLC